MPQEKAFKISVFTRTLAQSHVLLPQLLQQAFLGGSLAALHELLSVPFIKDALRHPQDPSHTVLVSSAFHLGWCRLTLSHSDNKWWGNRRGCTRSRCIRYNQFHAYPMIAQAETSCIGRVGVLTIKLIGRRRFLNGLCAEKGHAYSCRCEALDYYFIATILIATAILSIVTLITACHLHVVHMQRSWAEVEHSGRSLTRPWHALLEFRGLGV